MHDIIYRYKPEFGGDVQFYIWQANGAFGEGIRFFERGQQNAAKQKFENSTQLYKTAIDHAAAKSLELAYAKRRYASLLTHHKVSHCLQQIDDSAQQLLQESVDILNTLTGDTVDETVGELEQTLSLLLRVAYDNNNGVLLEKTATQLLDRRIRARIRSSMVQTPAFRPVRDRAKSTLRSFGDFLALGRFGRRFKPLPN